MKKPLTDDAKRRPLTILPAAALAVALAVLAPVAAHAAVPKQSPDRTMTCSDGVHKVLVWDSHGRMAVNNGCRTDWLQIWSGGSGSGESSSTVTNVEPGAHFNRKGCCLHTVDGQYDVVMRLAQSPEDCPNSSYSWAVLRKSHGKTTRMHCHLNN